MFMTFVPGVQNVSILRQLIDENAQHDDVYDNELDHLVERDDRLGIEKLLLHDRHFLMHSCILAGVSITAHRAINNGLSAVLHEFLENIGQSIERSAQAVP